MMTTYVLPEDHLLVKACADGGGVFLYPTEGVLGLGCDPRQQAAVSRIQTIKKRDPAKGMICVASEWSQVRPWVDLDQVKDLEFILATWPGPRTWIFPASDQAPYWLQANDCIALRVSDHPVVRDLCQAVGGAFVSTSANPSGAQSWLAYEDVDREWLSQIDACIAGEVGGHEGPSLLFDAITHQRMR